MWIKYSLYSNGRNPFKMWKCMIHHLLLNLMGREKIWFIWVLLIIKKLNKKADPNTPEGAPEQYVWSKIRESVRTPFTLDLSNDNVSVPANSSGTTGSTTFNLAETDIKLYYGNDVINPSEYTL